MTRTIPLFVHTISLLRHLVGALLNHPATVVADRIEKSISKALRRGPLPHVLGTANEPRALDGTPRRRSGHAVLLPRPSGTPTSALDATGLQQAPAGKQGRPSRDSFVLNEKASSDYTRCIVLKSWFRPWRSRLSSGGCRLETKIQNFMCQVAYPHLTRLFSAAIVRKPCSSAPPNQPRRRRTHGRRRGRQRGLRRS